MADVCDMAEQLAGAEHERNIAEIRKAAQRRELKPNGRCHFCKEILGAGSEKIFCDSDCAEDHERLTRNKTR